VGVRVGVRVAVNLGIGDDWLMISGSQTCVTGVAVPLLAFGATRSNDTPTKALFLKDS
jgi:hypothetical protein